MPRFPTLVPLTLLATAGLTATGICQGPPRLLGWNDLGMHCMDGDTSVFSILPPFNTFHAQLIVNGNLVTAGGYTVTYEAVADPSGSINRTSIGKTDFWQHAQALFGVNPPLDQGLAGFRMPGAANSPQAMAFQSSIADWKAEGVPMTPYDDAGTMNPYPLLRLVARNAQGAQIAATDIVVPVSAEMACVSCHGSGHNPDARPASGWVFGPAATDDRLNIVKLHDRHLGEPLYDSALTAVGYSAQGLFATVVQNQTPVLCAACHSSIALGADGVPGVSSMTSAMHTLHGQARLPDGRLLDSVQDRSSCYTCHPGAATRCLRGAMGKAIDADGEAMMSCQDCHGGMAEVGDPARTGWLQEPACQNCHTGDAVQNAGEIRFDHAFDSPGHLRTTSNARFATDDGAPALPWSLYRFSTGHGELECSACHGSPHAIWPSNETNDNLQSIATQGHVGTINECSACHSNLEDDELMMGPHGMHPTGQSWVNKHNDVAEHQGTASCQVCHGTDSRGTVLSRVMDDRTITTQFGTRTFWRGYEVGCYECHNGPNSENPSNNAAPVVQDRAASTPTDEPLALLLTATDANNDPLTLRIVSQPAHGAVAFDGHNAVYRAHDEFSGTDTFTYAASDHKRNSNLGVVTVQVGPRACAGRATPFGYGCGTSTGQVPTIALQGCPVANNPITFQFDQLPTLSFGLLAMGPGDGPIELGGDGCALRMDSLSGTTGLMAITNGSLSLSFPVPATLGALDASFQLFALAPTEARGFVATPGLAVEFR